MSASPRTNLLPRVWGNPAWMFLYTIALGYPKSPTNEDKHAARQFVHSLQYLLPCEKCRVNFRQKINGAMGGARLENAVQNNETLARYVYDLEAAVAETTGKVMPSYETTREKIMTNQYLHRQPANANANANATAEAVPTDDTTSSSSSPSVAVWVIGSILIVVACVMTWMITSLVLKKRQR